MRTLNATAVCLCSLGAGDAVCLLLWSRCTTLVGYIDKAQENIEVLGLLWPQNGLFWNVVIVYYILQKTYFSLTLIYKSI